MSGAAVQSPPADIPAVKPAGPVDRSNCIVGPRFSLRDVRPERRHPKDAAADGQNPVPVAHGARMKDRGARIGARRIETFDLRALVVGAGIAFRRHHHAECGIALPVQRQLGEPSLRRREEHGQEYLLKLSEHPNASLQLFASNYLQQYAAGSPQRIRQLEPYLLGVLSRVNKGRVAKDRTLAFLEAEAAKSEEAAAVVAEIVARQSATCAVGDKARMIEIMVRIRSQYPQIPLPVEVQPVEVRGGV